MKAPDIKMNVYRIICYSVKYHGHTFGQSVAHYCKSSLV